MGSLFIKKVLDAIPPLVDDQACELDLLAAAHVGFFACLYIYAMSFGPMHGAVACGQTVMSLQY